MGEEEVAPHQIVDDAKGQAETAAYADAIGDGPPTGEEPVTDVDGREVGMEEMPANGVWPSQEGDLADRDEVEVTDAPAPVDTEPGEDISEEEAAARAAAKAQLEAEHAEADAARSADEDEAQAEAERVRAEVEEQARLDAEAAQPK